MKLNLGCGRDIKPGFVNLDREKRAGVDVVHNLNKFPYPFKDNQFEYIYADNVLEHLDDVYGALRELHRISKNTGLIYIKVPYYNCAGMYNSPEHKSFFNANTFKVVTEPEKHGYASGQFPNFELISQNLIPTRLGKLIYPGKLRYLVSLVLGEVFKEIHVKLRVIK